MPVLPVLPLPGGFALDPDSLFVPFVPQAVPFPINPFGPGPVLAVMAESAPTPPAPPAPPAEQPYPPPIASNPCCESTICTVSGLFAGPSSELTGVMQYVYQSLVFSKEYPEASAVFASLALDEMHHLQLLGELLLSMGVCPRYTASPGWWSAAPSVVSYETCLCKALSADMENESADAARYRRLAESLCDDGIRALFLRLAMDEEAHLAALELLFAANCPDPCT